MLSDHVKDLLRQEVLLMEEAVDTKSLFFSWKRLLGKENLMLFSKYLCFRGRLVSQVSIRAAVTPLPFAMGALVEHDVLW